VAALWPPDEGPGNHQLITGFAMPSPTSYLAIDLGASSGRAVLGTLEDGRMAMREVRRFPSRLVEEGRRLYWDVGGLWEEVRRSVAEALRLAPGLRSVSVDSWAVDYVSLGADGAPLGRPRAYRDERTRGRLPDLFRRVPAEAIYARTGIQFLEFNTLPQVMVEAEEEPERTARTALRLLIADWFLYRLSGEAVAERTIASTTQLMDVRTGEWAEELIRAAGDDPSRWPQIVAPGTVLGPVREAALRTAGGRGPLVVAGCSHDTAAAVAAVPASGDAPWAYVSSGTWSLVGAELPGPVPTDAAREAGFTNEAGLGGTIRFLKNRTGMWVLEECMREWAEAGDRPSWEALLAAAADAPSAGGTLDLDAPEFGARGGMTERLEAACRAAGVPVPSTRGALARLVLESLAGSYRRTLAELEALTGTPVEVVHVEGGGARNRLLHQLTADACGRRILAGPEEATALGNLLVQARALGDLPAGATVRDAARRSAAPAEFVPDRRAPDPATALPTHRSTGKLIR
jgi:rhamnulokinase